MKKFLCFCFGISFYFLLPSMIFGLDKTLESAQFRSNQKIYALSIESQYLNFIVNGSKTLEIRVGVPNLKGIEKDDLIYFYDEIDRCAICQVVYATEYRTFDQLLAMEGIANSIPDMEVNNKSGCELINDGVLMIDALPTYKEKVKVYGALAIKLNFLNFCTSMPPKVINVNGA